MRGRAPKRKGGGPPGINNLNEVATMWPTPAASLINDEESPETFLARQEGLKAKGINGNGAGTPLTMAVKLEPMPLAWPTASARDWKSGHASDQTLDKNARPLNEIAMAWATPRATDCDKMSSMSTARKGVRKPDSLPEQIRTPSHLWSSASTTDAKGRAYTRDGGKKGAERLSLTGEAQTYGSFSPQSAPDLETETDGPASSPSHPSFPRPCLGPIAQSLPDEISVYRLWSEQQRRNGAIRPHIRRFWRPSLNPSFVEWLMAWPPEWTACACSATAFIHWQRRMRTSLSRLRSSHVVDTEPKRQMSLL